MTTAVTSGVFANARTANRVRRISDSNTGNPRRSRYASLAASMPPNFNSA
ncbi:MAG: hypothetical protein ACK5AZ_03825 [Bryobacteraceae bacterium]